MLDNTEQVEQITKVPSTAPTREKDPKRVAAGKKLAEKNKRMREENAQYKAAEEETSDSHLSDGFLSQLTLGNVLSLLGVGLSIYALFFKGETKGKDTWKEPVETTFSRLEEKQPPKPKPKFGM